MKSRNVVMERLRDEGSTVIRGGFSIAYDPPFKNLVVNLGGGGDRVTVRGTPPKQLKKLSVNCGPGPDLAILIDVDFGPTKFGSCEQVKR